MDSSNLQHPALKKLIRSYSVGEYLFRQGQQGNTMFIILVGTVELVGEQGEQEHKVAVAKAGEFLGEKAILKKNAYQRAFSAKALEKVVALELGLVDIEEIERNVPSLMTSILKKSFQLAIERLERANDLIRILRSSNNDERLIQCLLYYCRLFGTKTMQGTVLSCTADSLHFYIDMDQDDIEAKLDELIEAGVLLRNNEKKLVVTDEALLLSFSETTKKAA